jgi:hypothetical protein
MEMGRKWQRITGAEIMQTDDYTVFILIAMSKKNSRERMELFVRKVAW